jgi:hypothetical protein
MFWKGAVEHAAANAVSSFTVAARALPFEPFRRTVNIGVTYKTMRDADAAPAGEDQGEADPTMAAPDGSTAPSSPGTSAAPSASKRSRSSASGTSATSPTSSASNPGTGTD